MALSTEDLHLVSEILIDRVEKTMDERLDRMEKTVEESIALNDLRIKSMESRVTALESVKRKAITVWTLIVMGITFAAKFIWDEFFRPWMTRGHH